MKLTTKIICLAFAAAAVLSCESIADDEDLIVYMAHPEEIKPAKPKNIDYAQMYKEAAQFGDSLRSVLNYEVRNNLSKDPNNPENELGIYWPDGFSTLPDNNSRMGYIKLGNGLYVSACPLGSYVFPKSFKKFEDFVKEQVPELPKAPDFDSIVASFPTSQVGPEDYHFESGMDYHTYNNAVTGKVDADPAIHAALDKALAQYKKECDEWEKIYNKTKSDFYDYVRNVKYAFLKKQPVSYYIWGNSTAMQAGDTPALSTPLPSSIPNDIAKEEWGDHWRMPTIDELNKIFGYNLDKTKYPRNFALVQNGRYVALQSKNGNQSSQALVFHLNGYMQPDGSLKEDNVQFLLLAKDRPSGKQAAEGFFFDFDEKTYGNVILPIKNGYIIRPIYVY